MSSFYTINWGDFVTDFLPPDKREDKNEAYITALLAPLQTLHNETYGVFRPTIEGIAKQNGQRILLEDILNTTFAVVGPQFIYIDNSGDDVLPAIFFNENEGLAPNYLFNESEATPFYFNNETEISNNKTFVVYVPAAVYALVGEPAIINEVDRLRPASTTYPITTY